MSVIAKLCQIVAKRMNLHEIPDRTDPDQIYIKRYHTADKQENASWFLHNIKLPDRDRNPHNHPYSWQLSILLGAPYTEEYFDLRYGMETRTKRRRVRFFNWIPGNRYHKITELHGDVWTIFIHGPKHGKSWGFWTEIGHVHNQLMQRYWEWQRRIQEESSSSSLPN